MAASSGSSDHINPKLPTWNGDWKTFSDFRFACLLELDGCKTDEKSLLENRLVRNLTDRAWECVLDIDREALRKADGVEYLLKFLKERRGKQEVDLLGDSLQQYFQNPDCFRKEGENLNDFEQRHGAYIRDITKAMVENGCTNTVPSEIYGWFAINKLFRLDATDIAMVKAQTASYKLDDVLIAMRKMWGGDSLSKRDAEKRKGPSATKTFVATAESSWTDEPYEDHETAWMNTQDGEPNDSEDDLEDRPPWLISQQTLQSWPISRKLARTSTRRLDGHWTNTGLLVGFIHREKEKEKKGPTKGFKAAA